MNDIINSIAESFKPLIARWPGSKSYGLAEFSTRNGIRVPRIGEDYVGPDDRNPVILYQRINNFTIAEALRTGTGDAANDSLIAIQVYILVYFDRKVTKLSPSEMMMYLLANLPDEVQDNDFVRILVKSTGGVMDSQAVFASEFQGVKQPLRIPDEKTMFQINYTISAQFKKGCFRSCPC